MAGIGRVEERREGIRVLRDYFVVTEEKGNWKDNSFHGEDENKYFYLMFTIQNLKLFIKIYESSRYNAQWRRKQPHIRGDQFWPGLVRTNALQFCSIPVHDILNYPIPYWRAYNSEYKTRGRNIFFHLYHENYYRSNFFFSTHDEIVTQNSRGDMKKR